MLIDRFYTADGDWISFTRAQGSEFAKRMARDFNPLHDADAKRFCVPGDLLFAVVLARYGVSQHMEFAFADMVTEGVTLALPAPSEELSIGDAEGRDYLRVTRGGDESHSEALIQALTTNYVEYSAHTFPDILGQLMAEQGVMINPARPLIMYQSMSIDLDTLDVESPQLVGDGNELQVDGRRGQATLNFKLLADGSSVGRGCKRVLLGGLRDYDEQAMSQLVESYNARRNGASGE